MIILVVLMALLSKRSSATSLLSGILQLNLNGLGPRRGLLPAVRYQVPPPRIIIGYQTLIPVQYPFVVGPPAQFPTLDLHLQPPRPSAPAFSLLPPYLLYR
ncbi:UNVERIFIED_CONTAM: hypothetical protein PYX00_009260 [Menopon gallinae]|uniref:Secreted protein n=1 Tax=Menopon gallinae TaxID=328185 RepID=A0AAW2HAD2_9NEOP